MAKVPFSVLNSDTWAGCRFLGCSYSREDITRLQCYQFINDKKKSNQETTERKKKKEKSRTPNPTKSREMLHDFQDKENIRQTYFCLFFQIALSSMISTNIDQLLCVQHSAKCLSHSIFVITL